MSACCLSPPRVLFEKSLRHFLSPVTYFRKFAFSSGDRSVCVSLRLQSLVQCPLMCQLLHTNSPFSLTDRLEHFLRFAKWVSQWYRSPLCSVAKLSLFSLSTRFLDLSLVLSFGLLLYLLFCLSLYLLGKCLRSVSDCLFILSIYHHGATVWKFSVRMLFSSSSSV